MQMTWHVNARANGFRVQQGDAAAARANTLIATEGPGFTITMNKKTVKAGTYTIVVPAGLSIPYPIGSKLDALSVDRGSKSECASWSEIRRVACAGRGGGGSLHGVRAECKSAAEQQ